VGAGAANPDHAWKALLLVNDWIRHSDAKAGVTLAFTGVLGTMLFNLTKNFTARWWLTDVLAVATCASLVTAAVFCALTLTPRVGDRRGPGDDINRLFYGSISKHFQGDRRGYC